MSNTKQHVSLDLSGVGFGSTSAATLLTTQGASPVGATGQIVLDPFAVYIARLSR